MRFVHNREHAGRAILLCIILLSFALRVHRLGDDTSFTADELHVVSVSMHNVREIWQLANKTPIQEIWVHLGALGLGYSEFSVYFMSVIPGVLAVAVVYRLGRLLFDRQVGLLCAFLLAFSAYHIYWSRSARYYALMTVFSSASFLCLYLGLATNGKKAWVGYGLFRTLGLYVHVTGLLILPGEVLFALAVLAGPFLREMWERRLPSRDALRRIRRRGRALLGRGSAWRSLAASRAVRFLIVMTIILLAFAPRWYPIVRNAYVGTSGLDIGILGLEEVEEVGGQLHVGWSSPFTILYLFDSWASVLHGLMMVGFAGGFVFSILRGRRTQAFFVPVLMITPFVVLASVGYRKPLNGRYLISLLPLYHLMVAHGISGFVRAIARSVRRVERYRALVLYGSLAAVMAVYAGLNAPKIALAQWIAGQNWRGVGRFLARTAQPEQLIVTESRIEHAEALQHYLPGFEVVFADADFSYQAPCEREDGFWVISQGRPSGYQICAGLRDLNHLGLVFRGGWSPDQDRASDLRPAYSMDLYVEFVNPSIVSAREAIGLYEDWIPQTAPHHLREHLTWAEAYHRLNQLDLAVSEYTLALTDGYVNEQLASQIYGSRGICWRRLGKTERAITDWQQAIRLADSNRTAYEGLGEAYLERGDVSAAEALYQAAVASNPGDSWPHHLLGDFYQVRGLGEQATAEFLKAMELAPHDSRAYQRLAQIYASQGEEAQIISLYQQAMENSPTAAWPHLQLGQYFQDVDKIAEAVVEYQRAAELDPSYEPQVMRLLQSSRWALGTVLRSATRAYSDEGDLVWWPDGSWVNAHPHEPAALVRPSTRTVEGQIRANQILIHPFGDQRKTYVEFRIHNNPFVSLHVGYGLADEVAGLTNGVGYTIEVRRLGAEEFELLFSETVTLNVWREQAINLDSYWGEDLDFRLVVDARGDYAYDWLQTTVELAPPPRAIWNLSARLAEARFLPGSLPLEWQGDGFYAADGSPLVTRSQLSVGGESLPGQIHLHPYSTEIDATMVFTLMNPSYRSMRTSYALADQAVGHSDGVDYSVSVSVDGGQEFTELVRTTVLTNTWHSELASLPPCQELVLKLGSSARQDSTFDWLQVTLVLFPSDDRYGPTIVETDERREVSVPGEAYPTPTPIPTATVTAGASPTTTPAATGVPTSTPSATPVTTPSAGRTTHIVQPRETLWMIASRYGTSVQAIAYLNGLTDPDSLTPGQELVIPGSDEVVITVTATASPTEVSESEGLQ